MHTIRAIMTDVGGVLIQTFDHVKRHEWEEVLHLPHGQLSKEVFQMQPGELATIGKISVHEIWDGLQEKFNLTDEQKKQIQKDFYAGDRINTVLFDFFRQLHNELEIIILSNAWDNARDIYTEKYKLDQIAEKMILSAEVGLRKPDEAIFSLAIKSLHTQNPDEILFIDDETPNIESATRMGFQTIHFTDTHSFIQELTNTYTFA